MSRRLPLPSRPRPATPCLPLRLLFLFALIAPSAPLRVPPADSGLSVRVQRSAEKAKPADKPPASSLATRPPMGWNSWNHYGCSVTEDVVRTAADALVSSGLAAAGYTYVNLDDCWSTVLRSKDGTLQADPATFPSGIKALADYVHSKGLKFGIYSDAGYMTCGLRPGSLGYEVQDAATFASWGVDYLKYDNCYNDKSSAYVRYHTMHKALNATGRPIFFSMCEWGVNNPAQWARGVADTWRTTLDIQDTWASMLGIADQNNVWGRYAAPGGWNDPDMLEVGNGGMSESEYRVHFSLWAIMKAPLLIGTDVQNMTASTLAILTNEEVIGLNQGPLGVQAKRVQRSAYADVWAGPLSEGRVVVALLNRASMPLNVSAHWSTLGVNPTQAYCVRIIWESKNLKAAYKHSIKLLVPPHDVALLTLSPLASKLSSKHSKHAHGSKDGAGGAHG